MKKSFLLLLLYVTAFFICLTSCSDSNSNGVPPEGYADIVVFGKIFTAESDGLVEAFAVKDGKYIAVGSKTDVQKYIGTDTKIIEQTEGMVMPGCTEGHGHYLMSNFYDYGNHVFRMTGDDDKASILSTITRMAKDNTDYIFGFGFDYNKLKEDGKYPTRLEIDGKVGMIPVFLQDSEGHKGLCNTYCLEQSGILTADGKVDPMFKYKNYVKVDSEGRPTGMLLEQAATYVRSHGCIPNDKPEVWLNCAKSAQQELNKMGYTAAVEGWANKFGMVTYDAIQLMDQQGILTLDFGMAYEIENLSPAEVEKELQAAVDACNKYTSNRVHANLIKLFEDGTPESGTGYMLQPNSLNNYGMPIWQLDELKDVTLKANAKGLSMHIHAMGDAAVRTVIDAYEAANTQKQSGIRNQIVHLRNVADQDYDRMAKNNIIASCGVLWHRFYPSSVIKANLDYVTSMMAEQYWYEGYPYQSFINHKVHTSISTDAPASSGSPTDPFGIMEIAVTGTQNFFNQTYTTAWDEKELVSNRTDFLRSLTIEGAHQMGSETTRGSIAVGKYADFILISQNVLECSATDLHNTQVLQTYFEGKCVYTAAHYPPAFTP